MAIHLRPPVARRLMRPTRGLGSAPLPRRGRPRGLRPPIWPCSGWSLPRFTPRRPEGRRPASSLWHWSSPRGGRALPATLRCGARTFLTPPGRPADARPSDRLADPVESTRGQLRGEASTIEPPPVDVRRRREDRRGALAGRPSTQPAGNRRPAAPGRGPTARCAASRLPRSDGQHHERHRRAPTGRRTPPVGPHERREGCRRERRPTGPAGRGGQLPGGPVVGVMAAHASVTQAAGPAHDEAGPPAGARSMASLASASATVFWARGTWAADQRSNPASVRRAAAQAG